MKMLPKKWAFVMVLLLIVVLLFSTYMLLKPKKVEKTFKIEDNCGIAFGSVIHTITGDSECQGRCRSQCISTDLTYAGHEFFLAPQGCHICQCRCAG